MVGADLAGQAAENILECFQGSLCVLAAAKLRQRLRTRRVAAHHTSTRLALSRRDRLAGKAQRGSGGPAAVQGEDRLTATGHSRGPPVARLVARPGVRSPPP